MLSCAGECRDSQRTLRRQYWIAAFPQTIRRSLNDSLSPSTKTSPSKIILSLPPRDIFLVIFLMAFTARHVGQAVLGVSIGTWHEMLQMGTSDLIQVRASSIRHGIRVVNSCNTCVGWDRTLLHGTGRYEGGLVHVGLAILLSSNTKRTWEKYQARVRDGTMQEDDLL